MASSVFRSEDALALAKIDNEIAQLDPDVQLAHACHLRFLRNTFSPIFQLPPEILSNIMLEYQQDFFQDEVNSRRSAYEPSCPRSMSWVKISHISSYWRDIALQCPILWSTISIPYTPVRFAQEFIHRSRKAPICLFIVRYLDLGEWVRNRPLLEDLLGRVTAFISDGKVNAHYDFSLDLSRAPIQHFKAIGWTACVGFNMPKSSLQHLDIQGSCVDTVATSERLVTLSIDTPRHTDRVVPVISELYHTLSSLVGLCKLTLKNTLSSYRPSAAINEWEVPNVTLPSLVSLNIQDPVEECSHFLSHLVTPSLSQLTVTVKYGQPTPEFCQAFTETLSKSSIPSTSPRLGLCLSVQNKLRLFGPGYSERVALRWAGNIFTAEDVLVELISKWPFKEIHILELDDDGDGEKIRKAVGMLATVYPSIFSGIQELQVNGRESSSDIIPKDGHVAPDSKRTLWDQDPLSSQLRRIASGVYVS